MKRAFTAWALSLLVLSPLFAADSADARERTRQTLLYGIDSQVLDAIQGIASTHDSSFNKELAQILSEPRSVDLRRAVLDLFRDSKATDGQNSAKAVLSAWETTPDILVVAAVQYLSAISSPGLASILMPMVDSPSSSVALAAIQGLGAGSDPAAAAFLVSRLQSPDFPEARKADCILALGSLKDRAAVEALLAIAGSADADKVRRMYAADALGKIGDPRALPVLRSMFAENDALIRLYAASALSRFSMEEAFPSLLQGLRDENVRVREQSAKALARPLSGPQADAAVPILSFKAEQDPEASVRAASIAALGAIGGDAATRVLLKIYAGTSYPLDSRERSLAVLAEKALSSSLDTIRKVIDAEWKSFDPLTLQATARALADVKNAGLKDIYIRLLDSTDPLVRSYAVRGIGVNGFSDLRDRVKQISERDPNPGTRREAINSLAKL